MYKLCYESYIIYELEGKTICLSELVETRNINNKKKRKNVKGGLDGEREGAARSN